MIFVHWGSRNGFGFPAEPSGRAGSAEPRQPLGTSACFGQQLLVSVCICPRDQRAQLAPALPGVRAQQMAKCSFCPKHSQSQHGQASLKASEPAWKSVLSFVNRTDHDPEQNWS